MAKLITVKSNLADKTRVALWEVHPDHPDGEVFIADDKEHKVAETTRVTAALRGGQLVEVRSFAKSEPKSKAKED
jgi:hypothetical protein